MELEEVNEKYAQLKEKYWTPELEAMSEEERLKTSQYAQYLHEMLTIGLEFAKSQKEKCVSQESKELMDITIKFYEDSLNNFTKTE
ncbi:MAG: hypothetical protein PHR06_12575 [Candidatus Cloacimonetes bacterium]|nr:hypothetical protein [Candidatus Cloacimonadota bacterium]